MIGNLISDIASQTGIAGGVYGVAQLSATATGTFFSDKSRYPYFSRVSASTIDQTYAIKDVLLYYSDFGIGWTDVALICTSEEYGIDTSMNFIEIARDNDITIHTFQQFLIDQTNLFVELHEIKDSGARVIIAFVFLGYDNLIKSADEFGLVGENYVWFVSHTVVGNLDFNETTLQLSQGVIGSFQYIPDSVQFMIHFWNVGNHWIQLKIQVQVLVLFQPLLKC